MKMLRVLFVVLFASLSGCVTLDDLASGESWFNAEPLATEFVRYTQPTILSPLAGDEIATSDEDFKSFDYSLTLGSTQPQAQMDLHKENLLSLITNKASRGSIMPWEASIEPGQQSAATSIWMASLDTKYEPDLLFDVDSEIVSMDTLAMAWIDDEAKIANDPLVAADIAQDPLGISTGVVASTSGSNLAWGEIISTSLRWIAMVFLAVVLLIPAGCSYAARLVSARSRSSPPLGRRRRRRSNDHAQSTISRAISNVATH